MEGQRVLIWSFSFHMQLPHALLSLQASTPMFKRLIAQVHGQCSAEERLHTAGRY